MTEMLSLSWETHQNNLCVGLGLLQQRGEFVDMTLAADGHHVKVHQMVMSLASPYIKDLISTAKCPHPIIFLNNISYTTLSQILQYIYSGEVLISKDKLPDLLAAGKALHIKGLREVVDENSILNTTTVENPQKEAPDNSQEHYKEIAKRKASVKPKPICKVFVELDNDTDHNMEIVDDSLPEIDDVSTEELALATNDELSKKKELGIPGSVQYSISNQGNLQVIVNRYVYNLKYIQKNLNRYWRCVDYAYRKCPANVYTNDKNEVIKRKCMHNHPFHDKKILQKIGLGTIFTAYTEAESRAQSKKTLDDIEIIPVPHLLPTSDDK